MVNPTIPLNEQERLDTLERYNVLDTLPEQQFDDITMLASSICNTPIALVSLIDKDRQFFKSKVGLSTTETPRDYAFCAHAINQPNELFLIPDSTKDERFFDNPLVTDSPNVVFYAGMPLVTPDGFALGTLCVIDNKPHELTPTQKDSLRALSNQVIYLLELKRKNELLTKSQKELEVFAQEMESFAYVAAHDLKEPVRMIKSYVTLLENKYTNLLDDKGKQYIHFAVDGSQRMENLIKDLLEYAKAGSVEEDVETTDINGVIKEVEELIKLLISEKKAIITIDNLPVITISKTAIKQLFQNLIVNALKYQLPEVAPVIHIGSVETKTHWQFSVSDNGIGIPEKDQSAVFKIFKRLHAKEKYSGSGIGLSICKKIVEKNGGAIWLKSEVGKGTTFYFTIAKNKGVYDDDK